MNIKTIELTGNALHSPFLHTKTHFFIIKHDISLSMWKKYFPINYYYLISIIRTLSWFIIRLILRDMTRDCPINAVEWLQKLKLITYQSEKNTWNTLKFDTSHITHTYIHPLYFVKTTGGSERRYSAAQHVTSHE